MVGYVQLEYIEIHKHVLNGVGLDTVYLNLHNLQIEINVSNAVVTFSHKAVPQKACTCIVCPRKNYNRTFRINNFQSVE